MVDAKRKPEDEWAPHPTRTLRQLSGFTPEAGKIAAGKFGGRADRTVWAAGFFRVAREGQRWWFIDPEGHPFIHVGVCSTAPGKSARITAALQEKFGTEKAWAEATSKLLRENGFNGTGGWSAVDLLRSTKERLVYTPSWNFMAEFGRSKRLTFQQPGHMGYPGDCIPVFHPEFAAFCDDYAKPLAATKNDPWLLGHYSDNELPAPADVLDKSLQLDTANPALAPAAEHARRWLESRKGSAKAAVTDDDREAFREHVFEEYFRTTTAAIRKYDPNHLCLGSRLHGSVLHSPGVLRAAGRQLDAIAMNIYGSWTPSAGLIDGWKKYAGKPMMVTEFYAKGADSGFANTTGAGWLVPTQQDRALFYQNFVLALLESRQCVGWHWFKYQDNDPEDPTTDPSNRDSNKGIVTIRYETYAPLLDGMRELNREVYRLADYFDR